MKVLHVIDSMGLGGAQTLVKGIFEYRNDSKNIYLFSLRNKEIEVTVNHDNVKKFNTTKKYSLAALFELKKLIKNEHIDILHCHLFKSQVFGWLLKKIWFPDIKLIFHEHGEIFYKHIFYKPFLKLAVKEVNLFIAISKETQRLLQSKINIHISNIIILYNFVNLNKFKPESKSNDNFVVGFAARLVKRKGWKEYIDAAKTILKSNDNITFIIAGDGKDRDKLIKHIGDDTTNIKYIGYVSDISSFYKVIDCFVIPSHFEPLGLTQLEAQASGVAVIASNVPGLNELLHNKIDCFLFDNTVQDLVDKILLIKNNNDLTLRFIRNGLLNASKFSIDKYYNDLQLIYKHLSI